MSTKVVAYSKEQLLRSTRYSPLEKDILTAELKDSQSYTHEQAAQAVIEFRKRKVTS